ncbi:MAG: hypothetical protein A07HR67_01457 [uncultured archaeon A07HR67]|nr:MAG: hypothetical protein A07HR67_01457 [uncultured archaeon A07HR67]
MATTDPADGSSADQTDQPHRPEGLLRDAREALRVERRRTVDEREAFETFRSRVRSIAAEASARRPRTTAPSPLRRDAGAASRGLVAVRNAYQETVMAVPHYDDEYNDTYERSLAAEFGPELAAALTRESTLRERCRSSVLAKIGDAITSREELLSVVESELESVSRAAADLVPAADEVETVARTEFGDERFGTLDAYRARLDVLANRCETVGTRRQRDRADGERSASLDDTVSDVQTYLYQGLPVTYPVLAAVAGVARRIESVRRDVERAMIYAESDEEPPGDER